jgi:hypothetical protein
MVLRRPMEGIMQAQEPRTTSHAWRPPSGYVITDRSPAVVRVAKYTTVSIRWSINGVELKSGVIQRDSCTMGERWTHQLSFLFLNVGTNNWRLYKAHKKKKTMGKARGITNRGSQNLGNGH